MKFIKQSSIDNLIDEVRIVDVIKTSEDLKKKGVNWFCNSPFTSEKSASFCVSEVKNTFYDYSGGFGGNAISFLMKRHTINYYEAIEKAASICGIVLEYEEQSEDAKKIQDEGLQMKRFVSLMAEQYQTQFHKLAATDWPKEMMITKRAFKEETLQAFMVGYAPNVGSFISTPAINNGHFELTKTLGYTNTKDGSSYDFFRNRVMFPIHNEKGDIVGFGGRISNNDEDSKYAKYMNSKESKLYLKDRILYGLWQAKKTIISSGKAILLEGYTDVMALHQAGAENAIATCGTSLSDFHAKLLHRFCKHVILFRDGDKAGLRAVHRDIDICLRHGFKVEVVICPDGEDPDSLSKTTDINAFIENNREDAIIWKAKFLQEEAKNPELISLEIKLRAELDEEIVQAKYTLATEEELKALNVTERKFKKKENDNIFKYIAEQEKELKLELADIPRYAPALIAQSVESMANTLHAIPNKIEQDAYVKMVAKILGQKPIVFSGIISSHEEAEAKAKKSKGQESEKKEYEVLGLPEGADKDQYLKDRFCVIGNSYWFRKDNNSFIKGTNFRAEALFHIDGTRENKRLCEITNHLGHKRLIDFDSKDLINFQKFQEKLIMEGFFVFEPGVSTNDFKLLTNNLFSDFNTAKELMILGLQPQGFFAFSNSVYCDDGLINFNKYGIVHIASLEKTEEERKAETEIKYKADVTYFYSPSHSEIYKSANEGDDPYENDRHFVYKVAPISLDQWANQMNKVFGDKGKLGVAFCIAANFRDLFIKHYNFFPLFGGFGQKDSGKSGFGSCLQAFFYHNLNPLELNTSTLVGLSRKLSRCKNTIVFCDEMRDDIDEAMHQTLKGTWNGIGREKGKGFDSNKTTVDQIHSAVYYSGQYLPTRDDGALPSRSIICNFENKEYNSDEKEQYNKLIAWNKEGISSFILDVIKHRDYVSKNLTRVYAETSKEMKLALKDQEYQNRVFDNYIVLLVIVKMLQDKFNFPFTYENYFDLTKEAIIENSETIADSDGLAAFWRIVEYLADPAQHSIKQGQDYTIEKGVKFEYIPKKGEKAMYDNPTRDKIIFINFNKVHQDYHKEVTKRQGEEVIGATTIRNYLKSKKYFIGLFGSRRMGDKCPSGYAFNYSMMKRLGILNLEDANDSQKEIAEIFDTPKKHQIITNPNQLDLK